MKAKSIKGRSVEEIKSAIEDNMSDGYRPTSAIVFTSEENDRSEITEYLRDKKIQTFGSSTGANFIDGDLNPEGTVVLLMDMKPEYFRIEIKSTDEGSIKEIAEQIGKMGLTKFKKPAFLVVSGGLATDGDDIVEGLEKACGKGTTIFGGLAADKLLMQKTYVFTNEKLTDSGLLALILNEEKISLKGLAVGGWKPIGIDRIITKSRGNVVYTIDNEPALDFIKRYAGLKEMEWSSSFGFVLASNFQLQFMRDNKHPMMRTPMIANEDGSIVFAGSLPEGSRVRLSLLPGFEVVDEAIQQFKKFKNQEQNADALILFSCAGRQLSLGPYVSEEINGIKETWNAPLAGFFCFGEIGRVAEDVHEFHNMTCSLAILREN